MAKKNGSQEFLFRDKLFPLSLFILLLFIIAAWVNDHFQTSQWFLVVLRLFSVLYAVIGQILGLASEDEESELKNWLRKVRAKFSNCTWCVDVTVNRREIPCHYWCKIKKCHCALDIHVSK